MKNLLLVLFLFGTTTLFAQTEQFSGFWTKINTTYVFEFDLILDVKNSNQVEGYFNWKVVSYDKNDNASRQYYEKKIGRTGKEYVRGIYNPLSGKYTLKGYKKEDPDNIIGIDTYNLKLDQYGNLEGTTNANGTGLGRIKGRLNEIDLL